MSFLHSETSRRAFLKMGALGALGAAAAPLLSSCSSDGTASSGATATSAAGDKIPATSAAPSAVASQAPTSAAATNAAATSSVTAPASSAKSSVTNVTMWGSFSGDQIKQINQQLASFNDSQSDIKVTYQAQEIVETKLLTALAAGDPPDVVLWDRYQTSLYAPKGALSAVDDLVSRDKVDLSDFFPAPLGELRVANKLYGLPMLVDNRSLLYNKTLLDKAGITPPTTWDELANAANSLTVRKNGKLARSGFAIDDVGLFNAYILQAGGTMLAADGKTVAFDGPAGKAVLDYWADLVFTRKVYENGFDQGVNGFADGTIAIKYDGPWNMPSYDAVKGLDYGVVTPPTGPGGHKGAITGGFGLVIPEGAKHRDEAWEFIKWWTTIPANSVAFAKISSWIPASVTAVKDPYFTTGHWPAFIETMGFATVRPNVPGYSDVEGKALDPQLQKFMSGSTSAKAALSTAASQGNQILAQARSN